MTAQKSEGGCLLWLMGVVICLGALSGLHAEVPPGHWEKVGQLEQGTCTRVVLMDGERREGGFVELLPGSIVILSDGNRIAFEKSNVREVRTFEPPSIWKRRPGLVGTGIGAGIGLAVGALAYQGDESGWGWATIPMATLIGAGSGLLVGKVTRDLTSVGEIVYRAADNP